MKRHNLPSAVTLLAIFLCCGPIAPGRAADLTYHLLREIPIGGEPGWDYLTLDAAARRLYITHATQIEVLDLDKEEILGVIAPTPGVHGFALASDLKRGFSSNGKEARSSIVDLDSLKIVSWVPTGEKPDSILYEPKAHEVYAFNGDSKSVTVFNAASGASVATISLPGKPEFARANSAAGLVYCNIEDRNEVVVIQTLTHKILYTWPVAPGQSPSSMAIDLAHHRLFVGCRNSVLVVLDSATGKVVATVPIAAKVDATVFDPDHDLIFSSCGEGATIIVHEADPHNFTTVQTLATAPGARTMALDPLTRNIYLPVAVDDPPGPDPLAPPKKSFKILVYGL